MINVYPMSDATVPRGQYSMLVSDLLETKPIQVGEWQAMDVSKSDLHKTHELEDVSLVWDRMPNNLRNVFPFIDYDWADKHFAERVSGQPLNPAPSHLDWPYAIRGNADHTADDKFDHTYPERFWPHHAGHDEMHWGTDPAIGFNVDEICGGTPGIRFNYGDLDDVINLLVKSPLTRQAYLPVWFPEDTGAVEGQRVPCTLGYHFMQRGGRLSVRYYLRSCDIYRHLSNDVYLAALLLAHVSYQVTERSRQTTTPMHFRPGGMNIYISSLHAFVGDKKKLNDRLDLNHATALMELL